MRSTALATVWGTIAVVFGVIALVGFIFVSTIAGSYNGLQSSKTDVETARADIDADLQRRFDLVPQLVGSVRGSMKQEQEVFGKIAEARTQYATSEKGSTQQLKAANEYESAISRLLVVMENYPELKSNDRVADLMTQIEGSENRIGVSRKRYNEVVTIHNKKIRSFPTNMLAGFFGIEEEPVFEAVEEANVAPTVELESVGE